MSPLPAFRYFGSFQTRGALLRSENPLEEVWSRVGRFGRAEYLQRMSGTHSAKPAWWPNWGPYATIRVRQACELRQASRAGSLVTRPLPLYYAFLGVLRGFLAIEKQVIASAHHGLSYSGQGSLLDARATVRKGTFLDYLVARNCAVGTGAEFTLGECISAIPEMAEPWVSMDRGWTHSLAVDVDARDDGTLLLRFYLPRSEDEFRASWQDWYPDLASLFTLEPTGTVLRAKPSVDTSSESAIADILWTHLWVPLDWTDQPVWYALRRVDPKFALPRDGYYFVALFILSNVVRYEPELLSDLLNSESDLGWLFERLLGMAERYYPQLLLHWVVQQPAFF